MNNPYIQGLNSVRSEMNVVFARQLELSLLEASSGSYTSNVQVELEHLDDVLSELRADKAFWQGMIKISVQSYHPSKGSQCAHSVKERSMSQRSKQDGNDKVQSLVES